MRLLNLWPLLLIAGGVGLIFRDRTPLVGLVLGLLVVAVMFVVGFMGAQLGLRTESSWLPVIEFGDFEGGPGELIRGSGNLVTETRAVEGATNVELSINANMEILQGTEESLVVTGDDNVLPLLLTNVNGGRLEIRYKPQTNVRTTMPLKILLTVKDLQDLRLSSSGNVKIPTLNTDDFSVTVSSSCNAVIGDIQADKITIRISSSGDITMGGNAEELDINISSSGNFQADNLEVQEADVRITSSGDATIWVVSDLQASISSSGNIYYFGNPKVRENLSSSGRLVSKGDK